MTNALPPARRHSSKWLWVTVFTAPLLFALQLMFIYFLPDILCPRRMLWVLYALMGLFLLLTGVGVGVSSYEWNRLAGIKRPGADHADELAGMQFLAVAAVMTSVFSFMVILASGVPLMYFDPCHL